MNHVHVDHHISSNPKHREGAFGLHLPKEHGATVAFVFASLLALKMSGFAPIALLAILLMSVNFLSLQNQRQLILIAGFSTLTMFLMGHPGLALILAAFAAGYFILHKLAHYFGFWLLQTGGMVAAGAMPLLIGLGLSGPLTDLSAAVFCGYIASVAASTACVQVAIDSKNIRPEPALLLATALFLSLIADYPHVALPLVAPYILESLWLGWKKRPSFKTLGILQTVMLAWTTFVLWTLR